MLDPELGGCPGQTLDAVALGQPLANDLPAGAGCGADERDVGQRRRWGGGVLGWWRFCGPSAARETR